MEWVAHHHNGHEFRCRCGRLHHWDRSEDLKGDHFEYRCECGLVHWKCAKGFDGTGPDWYPPIPLPPTMGAAEVDVLKRAAGIGKKRRLLNDLYGVGLMLQRRGYLWMMNASSYGATDEGWAALRALGIHLPEGGE